MIIHCIGDSHANFFCGSDEMQPEWPNPDIKNYHKLFKSYRIGPALAYNLCRLNTATKGRERLLKLLSEIPEGSNILFCFGEIDCRAHIVLQAESQGKPVDEIVETVVDRYYSVITETKKRGFNMLIWNVIPSAPSDINSKINVPHQYIFHGTCEERNNVTRKFNSYLKSLTQKDDIIFLNFFNKLIGSNGSVKKEYYSDEIHLSQEAMPIVIQELKKHIKLTDY